MGFPSEEQVRRAVEQQLHEGLEAMPGDWTAILPDGRELEFRPGENGTIDIEFCLDDAELETLAADEPAEKTYRLRVRVELVSG